MCIFLSHLTCQNTYFSINLTKNALGVTPDKNQKKALLGPSKMTVCLVSFKNICAVLEILPIECSLKELFSMHLNLPNPLCVCECVHAYVWYRLFEI